MEFAEIKFKIAAFDDFGGAGRRFGGEMEFAARFLPGMFLREQRERADALDNVVFEAIGWFGIMDGTPTVGRFDDQAGGVAFHAAQDAAKISVAMRVLDEEKFVVMFRAEDRLDAVGFGSFDELDGTMEIRIGQRNGR